MTTERAAQINVGALSFQFAPTGLRYIRWQGVELIRGIMFLVRDRDWGTLAPEIETTIRQDTDHFAADIIATYRNAEANLTVKLAFAATQAGLSLTAKGTTNKPFETNRTGFTILHPADLAGTELDVAFPDGKTLRSVFPDQIAPWQPFKDIVGLSHTTRGITACCTMSGDTFEMEDQRQWGDASYKTYNRPLGLPWPYYLPANEPFHQSVEITWSGHLSTDPTASLPAINTGILFPEMALVIDAADAGHLASQPSDISAICPQRLLCSIDMAKGKTEDQVSAFAQLQRILPDTIFDAELICTFSPTVSEELQTLCAMIKAHGFTPDSILVCPSVDRQSTPPGSHWPACPPQQQIHATAARVFPDMVRGGGMVSFFPELNRKRPPLDDIAFVSHGLCPIVHAADDRSVMETLDAVAHITRSARTFIGDKDYRIGPCTIAMRQNPYGQRTIPNPDGSQVCMTDDDPRHRTQFGAAYVIGLATALAPGAISVWTPAAVYGPRGLEGPIVDALKVLASCAGQLVHHAAITNGLAELHVGSIRLRANLTPEQMHDLPPYGWDQSNLAAKKDKTV